MKKINTDDIYSKGLFIWENSIPGTRIGSPRRDLAISLVSLENSPCIYMVAQVGEIRSTFNMH